MSLNPYRNTFARKAVEITLKALDALWIVSGDLTLMLYARILKDHLRKKMEEAVLEEAREKTLR